MTVVFDVVTLNRPLHQTKCVQHCVRRRCVRTLHCVFPDDMNNKLVKLVLIAVLLFYSRKRNGLKRVLSYVKQIWLASRVLRMTCCNMELECGM